MEVCFRVHDRDLLRYKSQILDTYENVMPQHVWIAVERDTRQLQVTTPVDMGTRPHCHGTSNVANE
jgi:hypothetical protein